jgi:hypothetical protein
MLDKEMVERYDKAIADRPETWNPDFVRVMVLPAFATSISRGTMSDWGPLDFMEYLAAYYAPRHDVPVPDIVITYLALEGRL